MLIDKEIYLKNDLKLIDKEIYRKNDLIVIVKAIYLKNDLLYNLLLLFWHNRHNRFYLIRILPFNSLQSTYHSIVIVVGASLLPEPSRILLVLLTKILIQI